MKNFSDQKKGTLLAFVRIMFITQDSLLIRLSNVESWSLIFYRGFIPFFVFNIRNNFSLPGFPIGAIIIPLIFN